MFISSENYMCTVPSVSLMCNIRSPLCVTRRLFLMDRPCLLLIMLYSHCSGTWTHGFCFTCQSNSMSADGRQWVLRWFIGLCVKGKSERKSDTGGSEWEAVSLDKIWKHHLCFFTLVTLTTEKQLNLLFFILHNKIVDHTVRQTTSQLSWVPALRYHLHYAL